MSDRLQIGLDGVATEVVPDRPGAVTAAGAAFDLFVNVTFMSADAAPHGNSLYVVHFPNPPELGLSKPRKAAIRGLRMLGGMPAAVEYRSGFFDRDPGSRGSRWTTGEGEVRVSLPRGDEAVPITFVFGAGRPEPTDVVVEAAGVDLASVRVGGPVSRARALQGTAVTVHLRGEGPHHERTVVLRSDTFVPVEHGRPDTARARRSPAGHPGRARPRRACGDMVPVGRPPGGPDGVAAHLWCTGRELRVHR